MPTKLAEFLKSLDPNEGREFIRWVSNNRHDRVNEMIHAAETTNLQMLTDWYNDSIFEVSNPTSIHG